MQQWSGVADRGRMGCLIDGLSYRNLCALVAGGGCGAGYRYMMWSMHIKKGAISSLMLMFLGEVSSVFFNPWLAARDYKKISGGKSMVRSPITTKLSGRGGRVLS